MAVDERGRVRAEIGVVGEANRRDRLTRAGRDTVAVNGGLRADFTWSDAAAPASLRACRIGVRHSHPFEYVASGAAERPPREALPS
jgi:hypothetical protein